MRKPRSHAQQTAVIARIDTLRSARAAHVAARLDYLVALATASDDYAVDIAKLHIDIETRKINNIDLDLARLHSRYDDYPAGAQTQLKINTLENKVSTLQIQEDQLRRERGQLIDEIADLRAKGAGSDILQPLWDEVASIDTSLSDLASQITILQGQIASLG